MNRTLALKLFTDLKTGSLALTVTHAETTGGDENDDGRIEKHSTTTTDEWGSESALTLAANQAVMEFLDRIRKDNRANLTPIERAARGE